MSGWCCRNAKHMPRAELISPPPASDVLATYCLHQEFTKQETQLGIIRGTSRRVLRRGHITLLALSRSALAPHGSQLHDKQQ
mmetsp:Transcript_80380/g.239433  ORF Transcript_80380/g.239433 Transcript_80380/m.239433 type:complete len:82 (+) Transcript_80380:715-960(+)